MQWRLFCCKLNSCSLECIIEATAEIRSNITLFAIFIPTTITQQVLAISPLFPSQDHKRIANMRNTFIQFAVHDIAITVSHEVSHYLYAHVSGYRDNGSS